MKKESLSDRNLRHNPLRGLDIPGLTLLIEEADEGRMAGLQWLMRRVERADDTVRSVRRKLRNSLAALGWGVSTADGLSGADRALAERQKDFLTARYNALDNLTAAAQHIAWADCRGYAHVEKIYGPDGWPRKLNLVPQWHWVRDGIYGEWRYNPSALPWPSETDTKALDHRRHWIIREVDDPACEIYATAFLRKALADRDWDAFMEGYDIPWLFLVGPPSMTPEQRKEWEGVARDVRSDGRGMLPHGSDVKEAGAGNRSANPFTAYFRHQNEKIVLASTNGLLTMLTAPGSGTLAGSAHTEAWDQVLSGVAGEVSETLQTDFDAPLLEAAFPGQPVLAWFEYQRAERPEERSALVRDVETLTRAGFRPDRSWVSRRTGVELDDAPAGRADVPPGQSAAPARNRRALLNATRPEVKALARTARETLSAAWGAHRAVWKPVEPELLRLADMAADGGVSAEDFREAAERIALTLPELVDGGAVNRLARELERGMSAAMIEGVRNALDAEAAAGKKKALTPTRAPKTRSSSR